MTAQNEEKMREAFEKWWDESYSVDEGAGSKGPYRNESPMQWSWEAWQAAIAQERIESQKREAELRTEITRLTELGRKNLGRAIVAENELILEFLNRKTRL